MSFQLAGMGTASANNNSSFGDGTPHSLITVPEGEYWRILGANAQFSTSATAGNRYPAIELHRGADGYNVADIISLTPVPASSGSILQSTPTPASSVLSGAAFYYQTAPFAPVVLGPGDAIWTDARGRPIVAPLDAYGPLVVSYEIWKWVP